MPSNTGAGYVIRRILRRAARYYYSYLGYKQSLLYQLLPELAEQFKHVFPELENQVDFVGKVIKEEEESFLKTLDKGLKKMEDIIQQAHTSGVQHIAGKPAFELYDTYGFPIDLTKLIATENSLFVDEKGFEHEMQQQKERSRAATSVDTEDWIQVGNKEISRFIGYDSTDVQTKVSMYRKVKSKVNEAFQFVLDTTPFYAESGGQVGDKGILNFDGELIAVTDTKKENDLTIHIIEKIPVRLTGFITAKIDKDRRHKIECHHSATHLLHAALRKVLGAHVSQKGSLVNDEHLRFDFSHFSKMSDEEITLIEKLVNEKIRENISVVIKEMPKEEAMKLGAMALFGEKYGNMVRVVMIDPQYSVELCGGTHVRATGELGIFKIKHETAIAAGVRRIEAVCGVMGEAYIYHQLNELRYITELLKNPKDIAKAIENLADENNGLKKKLESLENKMLAEIKNELLRKDEIINGIRFIGDIVEVSNPDALKKLCYDLKNNLDNYVAVLCSNIGGKATVAIGISDTVVATKNLDAGKILKEHVAGLIKGGGVDKKILQRLVDRMYQNWPRL